MCARETITLRDIGSSLISDRVGARVVVQRACLYTVDSLYVYACLLFVQRPAEITQYVRPGRNETLRQDGIVNFLVLKIFLNIFFLNYVEGML